VRATREGVKRCSKCGETKPVSEFSRHSRSSDGLKCDCKQCHREYMREYHQRPEVKARKKTARKGRTRDRGPGKLRHKSWATDPRTRINNSMRLMIFNSLGNRRSGWRWELLVGYTLDELMAHLESRFT